MIKANEFNKLVETIKQKEEEKNKRVQADMKLVEDSLNDLYIKIEKNKNLGNVVPKYTTLPKILEKEVIDELILNQGYFVYLNKQGNTRIYYSKEDFDNRIDNSWIKDENLTKDKIIHDKEIFGANKKDITEENIIGTFKNLFDNGKTEIYRGWY